MTNKKYEFTKTHSFHGEFWHNQDDNKGRFSAKIEYSSYDGLTLDYCISDSDSPTQCERLYGILNTGTLCTLIGPFDFSQGRMHLGKARILTGLHPFSMIFFDGFYDENKSIEYCDLSLNGLQEFMHPQGLINRAKHQWEPIFSCKGTDWQLDVINNASFTPLGNGLMNLLDCTNKQTLAALSNFLSDINKNNPNSHFMIRKKLLYFFRYKNSTLNKVKDHINQIWNISGLLSILLNKPIIPDELYFKFKDSKTKTPCLFTISYEQRTINLALKEIHHHSLPVNRRQVNLEKIFTNWFEIADNYLPLTVTYQYETGFRTLPQAHSDIILFATQLEAINLTLNGKPNEKYINPINEYASQQLKKDLEEIFIDINDESLGSNIATLRNELAHVDRKKILMKKMTLDDYIRIGTYLKIIITSHLLSKLGVEKEQVETYQSRVAP